jgi:phosphoglucomutase
MAAATTHEDDYVLPYVRDLGAVVEMDAIRGARLTLAVVHALRLVYGWRVTL